MFNKLMYILFPTAPAHVQWVDEPKARPKRKLGFDTTVVTSKRVETGRTK